MSPARCLRTLAQGLEKTMSFPDFFARAPILRLRDPLAAFLGATADAHGVLEYRFEDAVRLAGHSCPTVAAAFLMNRAALAALYGEELPMRGDLRVEFAGALEDGVVGVIAAVTSLITGAAGEGGFRGLGGRFGRRQKLLFGQSMGQGELRFSRLDNGRAVTVAARLEHVPVDPGMSGAMAGALADPAGPEAGEFRRLWQDRVRRILLDHADDPRVFAVRPV